MNLKHNENQNKQFKIKKTSRKTSFMVLGMISMLAIGIIFIATILLVQVVKGYTEVKEVDVTIESKYVRDEFDRVVTREPDDSEVTESTTVTIPETKIVVVRHGDVLQNIEDTELYETVEEGDELRMLFYVTYNNSGDILNSTLQTIK